MWKSISTVSVGNCMNSARQPCIVHRQNVVLLIAMQLHPRWHQKDCPIAVAMFLNGKV